MLSRWKAYSYLARIFKKTGELIHSPFFFLRRVQLKLKTIT